MPDTTVLKPCLDDATNDQIERANEAVAANLNEHGLPKYDSAFGYACALTAIMQADTRTPSSATPEVAELIERLTWLVENDINFRNIGAISEAATALETLEARVKVLEEALQRAVETLAASRHLIGKYTPYHHWLPEHDERIAELKAALPKSGEGE